MSDGYIQAPPDSTGKLVDAEIVSTTASTTVYRLRVAVPDEVKVSGDLLELLYLEMKATNDLLAQAFGLGDQLESLREHGELT